MLVRQGSSVMFFLVMVCPLTTGLSKEPDLQVKRAMRIHILIKTYINNHGYELI